ncbi:MAG: hypothetical protein Kow0090_11530 [Myxococcota bacterium]
MGMFIMRKKNIKKILGAVLSILKKYHSDTGLRIYAEEDIREPAKSLFTFYIPAYSEIGKTTLPNEFSLSIYQRHIGLPALTTGGFELAHPEQDKVELDIERNIVPYYLNRLELENYFMNASKEIRAFHKSEYLKLTERYLVAMRFLWLFSSSFDDIPTIYIAEDGSPPELSPLLPIDIYKCDNLFFTIDGRVLSPDGETLDIFSAVSKGITDNEIIDKLQEVNCQ